MFDNKKIVFGVLILFVAYFVDYYFIHSGENTVVDINNGKLKGIVTTSRNGREYYEFLGKYGTYSAMVWFNEFCVFRNPICGATHWKITIYGKPIFLTRILKM